MKSIQKTVDFRCCSSYNMKEIANKVDVLTGISVGTAWLLVCHGFSDEKPFQRGCPGVAAFAASARLKDVQRV